MATGDATTVNETTGTWFYRALRWRVHNLEEALAIAATHRARAAEARCAMPAIIDSFLSRSQALELERRASRHDELAAACERHAAGLRTSVAAKTSAGAKGRGLE